MKQVLYHVIVPALMPAAFFAIAFTPVHVFGCRGRGLLALLTAFISGLAALTATVVAHKRRGRGDTIGAWWAISTLILLLPVAALIIMA